MDKHEEFDKDFDFEKEYGFDPKTLLDPEYENDAEMEKDFDASFDQDFLADFDEKFDAEFNEKFAAEFVEEFAAPVEEESAPEAEVSEFVDEELPEEAADELIPEFVNTTFPSEYASNEATKVLPAFDLPDYDEKVIDPSVFGEEDPTATKQIPVIAQETVEDTSEAEEPEEQPKPRRRKLSRERLIKEVYLPPIIAGLTLVLCLTFIIGGIARKVGSSEKTNTPDIGVTGEDPATVLQRESEELLAKAAALAAGYDYQGALDTLNSFSDADNMANSPRMIDKRAEYATLKDQVQAWNDPSSITNLSFHSLIVDPSRAFADKQYGPSYKMNFVTVSEFTKILEQIYFNGYVMVDFDSFVEEVTAEDGTVTYKSKPIYLPAGKKPFMLTTTLVNYFDYMIQKDEDGDYGDGFARKLMVDNGKLTNEYQDASGNITYGAYDLIPILENFLEAHPDFSYQGARAIVAVTGEEGIFGYRTMPAMVEKESQEYFDNEVKNAKEVVQKLRDLGYTLACNTYGNETYLDISATEIKADLDLWAKEVTPVIGEIDVMVYARGSDITTGNNYSGNKYNVLHTAGFRYFVGAADVAWAEVTNGYVRQTRMMVTGTMLQNAGSTFSSFFDAKSVLSSERNLSK